MFCVSQVCSESQRFEKLMEHFKNEDNNIDFMVGLYYRVLPLSSGVPFKLSCSHHYWCHISSSFPVRDSGGVHAVHQYCGALSRGHELQSSPPVRLHQACFGWLSRGMKLIKVLKVYSLYAHSETDGVFVHRGWSTLKVINSKCRSRHTWITCLMWGRF